MTEVVAAVVRPAPWNQDKWNIQPESAVSAPDEVVAIDRLRCPKNLVDPHEGLIVAMWDLLPHTLPETVFPFFIVRTVKPNRLVASLDNGVYAALCSTYLDRIHVSEPSEESTLR